MNHIRTRVIFTVAVIAIGLPTVTFSQAFDENLRPEIVVADADSGCPSVAGAFVTLLDPARGMLLLSAAPFPGGHVAGDVGFDRQFWSSEGDLVTYMRWLVEEVYLELPPAERQRRPDFRLADRRIDLRVDRPGYGPFRLSGKEGSTLACRYQDGARIYLLMPFVLDEATGRIAVKIAYTDGEYFDTSVKAPLGWVFSSPGEPGTLADPPLTIPVEGLSSN